MAFVPRVFSGIKPSGDLHLGNYLGAIRRFVPLQQTHETIYCVVDMHAITVWQDPEDLRRWTYEIAAAYIAAGLDPKKSIIFNQSQVVEHAELGWIFNCVARVGWMTRMTQFKDKAGAEGGENSEAVSLGLFAYPSLMAADILLYKSTGVPVGDDQRQHLELTRDIAKKFNHDFRKQIESLGFEEDYFPLTDTLSTGPATRVMSLKDGKKKMSKSDASDMSTIYMMDDADTISKKIKRATTDPEMLPTEAKGLENRPEAENLVAIYAALCDKSVDEVLGEFGGSGWGRFKPALADLAVAVLSPVAEEMKRLVGDRGEMDRILRDGAERARAIAAPHMDEIRRIVGFVR
jgi:tryptophanyl-tRNA synthetase